MGHREYQFDLLILFGLTDWTGRCERWEAVFSSAWQFRSSYADFSLRSLGWSRHTYDICWSTEKAIEL